MSITGAEVQGADEVVRTLHSVAGKLADLSTEEAAAAELLADKVQTTAPRQSGYMANHVSAQGGRVVVGAPYAVYVNARNPFVARARAAVLDDIEHTFTEGVADAFRAAGRQ